jgi:two-component system response regulator
LARLNADGEKKGHAVSDPLSSNGAQTDVTDSLESVRRPILLVEDDPVDQEMISLAFKRAAVKNLLVIVANGKEALEYLLAHGQFQERRESDLPAVIILDLNMPEMDGFEFLRRVKAEPRLRSIPVVVLTTSQFDRDLSQSYALGANSCLTKPAEFEQLVKIASDVNQYWCRRNRIPENG